MNFPLHCRRLDQHPEHHWTAPLSRRTYHCTGHVIHSHAEDDAADDDYEARLDREKRDVA